MNPLKLGAIILILTAGLAGGYLIIKDSKTTGSGSYITLESSGKAPEKSSKSPIQWMEKAKDFLSNPIESLGLNDKVDENISNNGAPFNLTEFVAKSVSNQMQTLDQKGVENIDPNDPKNQEAIKKAMAELQNFSLFDESISDKDLKISQDNSKKAKQEYFKAIGEISQKNFSGFNKNYVEALSEVVKKNNTSFVVQLANIYKNIINDYLNLVVPSDLAYLHKKMIIHFKTAQRIYEDIANFNADPIRAQLSFEMIDELIVNAETIQNQLDQKIKEAGL